MHKFHLELVAPSMKQSVTAEHLFMMFWIWKWVNWSMSYIIGTMLVWILAIWILTIVLFWSIFIWIVKAQIILDIKRQQVSGTWETCLLVSYRFFNFFLIVLMYLSWHSTNTINKVQGLKYMKITCQITRASYTFSILPFRYLKRGRCKNE
jgi:hypothetical protein